MEPAPDLRVEHPRQIFNGLAAAQMQLPVPNLRPHRLARLVCDCRTEVADGPPPILRPPGPKCIPQNVEAAYTKTYEARNVPRNETLTATLKQLKMHGDRDPMESVFQDRQMMKACARASARGGIIDFTFHDQRHIFASRLVMAGVDLATVKELMGHKHRTMTLRYPHFAPGHKRLAIEALDRVPEKVPVIFTIGTETRSSRMPQVIEK
jgi:Phage integrase family